MSKKILLITGTIFSLSSVLIVYASLKYPSLKGFSALENIAFSIFLPLLLAVIVSVLICSIYGLFFLHKNLFKQKFSRAIPLVFLGLYATSLLIILKATYHKVTYKEQSLKELIDEKIKETNPADSSLIVGNANDSILSPEIGQLSYLTNFVLIDTKVKKLPTEFSKLQNLTALTLTGNAFEIFPQEIFALTKLEYLDIQGNQIKEIPFEITKLANLKTLTLCGNIYGGNPISSIPPYIGQLKNLESLTIRQCVQIDSLPMELSNLKKLKELNIYESGFKSFPTVLCELENLEWLMISFESDSLPPTPACISRLKKLKNITVRCTQKDKDNLQKLLPNTKIDF